jgi:hypothetical protein
MLVTSSPVDDPPVDCNLGHVFGANNGAWGPSQARCCVDAVVAHIKSWPSVRYERAQNLSKYDLPDQELSYFRRKGSCAALRRYIRVSHRLVHGSEQTRTNTKSENVR